MNTDNTQIPDSGNEFESAMESADKAKTKKKGSDKAANIGAGLGAAAVGAAAGIGTAEAIAQITEDDVLPEDIHIDDIDGPAPQNPASAPAHSASGPAPVVEEGPVDVEEPVEEPEITVQPEEPEEIVTPSDDIVNPDDVVDEILAVEEIDIADSPGDEMFSFSEMGTIYTIDGEELSAASFSTDDGFEGLMVDIDGDGVYDEIAIVTEDGIVGVAQAPGFTVDDVELQLSEENGYLAHNDDIDHTLEDDSFLDDLIDPTTLA